MSWLSENCTLQVLSKETLEFCYPFDCGHSDLNDFFHNDSIPYAEELIGKSYCFTLDEDPKVIICAFTISNDSVKVSNLPNARKKKLIKDIPRPKHLSTYPAVLIGRLGVNKNFGGKSIGRELMDFIKAWFVDGENKTGCRFIVVDSYNEDIPRKYYNKCGFEDLFSSEEQENQYLGKEANAKLYTRLMYFDLIVLKSDV